LLRFGTFLVADRPRTVLKMLLVFQELNINILSLSSGPILDPSLFRITIEYVCSASKSRDLIKKISDHVDVLDAYEMSDKPILLNELGLFKINTPTDKAKAALHKIIELFEAEVVDETSGYYIIEVTGEARKLESFVQKIEEECIVEEIARSGKVAFP
jgi:acetolactate synthase I/III small subunit